MALDKPTLTNNIKQLLENQAQNTGEQADAFSQIAEALADYIDAYVKSIKITIPAAAIQVQGSASAQQNVAAIVLENTVS